MVRWVHKMRHLVRAVHDRELVSYNPACSDSCLKGRLVEYWSWGVAPQCASNLPVLCKERERKCLQVVGWWWNGRALILGGWGLTCAQSTSCGEDKNDQ